jgi:hypothetical protein
MIIYVEKASQNLHESWQLTCYNIRDQEIFCRQRVLNDFFTKHKSQFSVGDLLQSMLPAHVADFVHITVFQGVWQIIPLVRRLILPRSEGGRG